MISIIMPLYNGEEFLQDSIPSILGQTYTKWELLIGINGHSEKEAHLIAKRIKFYNDPRIKIIITNSKSKSKTLNKLAYHAKYRYLAILDVDDCWVPSKLEEQVPYLTQYDIIGSDAEYFGSKEGSPGLFLGKLSSKMFRWQNPIINSAAILKKSDAFWDSKWEGLDDYNMWLHLLNEKKTFFNVPKPLVKHRIHNKSFFNNKNGDKSKELMESIPKLSEEDIAELSIIMSEKKWEL